MRLRPIAGFLVCLALVVAGSASAVPQRNPVYCPSVVPEPGAAILFSAGLAIAARALRREGA